MAEIPPPHPTPLPPPPRCPACHIGHPRHKQWCPTLKRLDPRLFVLALFALVAAGTALAVLS